MVDLFNVYWAPKGGDYTIDLPAVQAHDAMRRAFGMSGGNHPAHRVMVTDEHDNCVFLWERTNGVIFPPKTGTIEASMGLH